MSDEQKKFKHRFKIGQEIWYIANGYVCKDTIRSIFVDKWDIVKYGFVNMIYRDNTYQIADSICKHESEVFATQEDLIKFIKEQSYE